jgi:arylsulfatase A-like enzyme
MSQRFLHLSSILASALLAGSTATAAPAGTPAGSSPERRPNVLLVIIDDHKPDLHDVFNAASPVRTPNMQRLAARSTWFTHAYVDSPACCPSRTAFLTGVHAAKSGVYYNSQAYRRASTWISKVQTLPGNFLRQGYLVVGYGKVAHNRFLEDDVGDYSAGHYRMFNRPEHVTHTDESLLDHVLPGSRVDFWHSSWSFGKLPDDWDRDDPNKLQQDTEVANHVADLVRKKLDQPFFAVCGFWRPHVSWTVPQRYFDKYPLDSISIPEGYRGDDLEDLPKPARWLATHREEHDFIVKNGLWKRALQAKYAATAYVDDQIGRVLDALESGPNNENTIIVFAADNGWHTGEKNHWSKFYLSELACRVVFAVSMPGKKSQISNTPVGLIDIYPTLNALCRLEPPSTHTLDGVDLTPVLSGTRADRGRPVLSTYGQGCHSLRDDRFRYTRFRDGSEELYDHRYDEHEWTNLAHDPRFAAAKQRLAECLPAVNAAPIEDASERDREADVNRWDETIFEANDLPTQSNP